MPYIYIAHIPVAYITLLELLIPTISLKYLFLVILTTLHLLRLTPSALGVFWTSRCEIIFMVLGGVEDLGNRE